MDENNPATKQDKSKKKNTMLIIFLALILLLTGIVLYRELRPKFDECYKAIYYAFEECGNKYYTDDISVSRNRSDKTVFYTINNEDRYPSSLIIEKFKEYLQKNPQSYLNDNYKISLMFVGDEKFRGNMTYYGLRNYDQEGNLHDDLDVAYVLYDERDMKKGIQLFEKTKGLKNLIIDDFSCSWYDIPYYYSLFSGVEKVEEINNENNRWGLYFTFYSEDDAEKNTEYRKIYFKGEPVDLTLFMENEMYFDNSIYVRENGEYIKYYALDLDGKDSPVTLLRSDVTGDKISFHNKDDSTDYAYYNTNIYNYLEDYRCSVFTEGMKEHMLRSKIGIDRVFFDNKGKEMHSAESFPAHMFILTIEQIEKKFDSKFNHSTKSEYNRSLYVRDICQDGSWFRKAKYIDEWYAGYLWYQYKYPKYDYISVYESAYVQPAFYMERDEQLVIAEDKNGEKYMVFRCDME